MRSISISIFFTVITFMVSAQPGHDLWLHKHTATAVKVISTKNSPALQIATEELQQGWQGKAGAVINLSIKNDKSIRHDGFRLTAAGIEANTDIGILYGAYELLRRQQTAQRIQEELCNPSYGIRILNHWDNPDGSIERGYAGPSMFWRKEDPFLVSDSNKRIWKEYARANASVGINGAVLNNVNASHIILSEPYLDRVKSIADILRPYGVKTYLSIKFTSPILLGGLKTADPLDPGVINWWKNKLKEIYTRIPDFGGFLVKANSEGQPGPQDYGLSLIHI